MNNRQKVKRELNGIIQPIMVRNNKSNTGFELISGARRLRAAKLSGLDKVPAIIKNLSDDEAIEVQIIENLQRQDIHPLEESESFLNLIKSEKYSVQTLAAKIGKSLQYIYSRIRLSYLHPELKQKYAAGEINFSAASELSKIPPAGQTEILTKFTDWGKELEAKEIKDYIRNSIVIDLKNAPFLIIDKKLDVLVGACSDCPKNTGCDTQLFPDLSGQMLCTDKRCYDKKLNKYLDKRRKQIEKRHQKLIEISDEYYGNDPLIFYKNEYSICNSKDENAKLALVVRADNHKKIGELEYVSLNKDNTFEQKGKATEDKLEEARYRAKKQANVIAINDFISENNPYKDIFLNLKMIKNLCKMLSKKIPFTTYPILKKHYEWNVEKYKDGGWNYYKFIDDMIEKTNNIDDALNLLTKIILWPEVEEGRLKPLNHLEYDYTVQIKIKRKKYGEMIVPVMTASVTATKLLIQTPWQLEIFENEDLMEIVTRKENEIKRKFKL
jgi:ParB/RepB/Spo0J family partition protein